MLRGIRTCLAASFAILSLAGIPSASSAQPFVGTLNALTPGGAQSGGVVIDGWRYSDFSFRTEGGVALDLSAVTVRITPRPGAEEPKDVVQFSFQAGAAGAGTGDVFVDYRLDVPSSASLSRVGLQFSGAVPSQGVGAGSASVTETVLSIDGADLSPALPVRPSELLFISNDGPGRLEDVNSAFLPTRPLTSLRLGKQITLSAREAGPLQITVSDSLFAFPEPGFAGVALPVAALALSRRRRRAA